MTEIMPRRAELVPRAPEPVPSRRIHRTRLRDLFVPPPVHSYLTGSERCVIATRRHWLAPLRAAFGAGGMMLGIAGLIIALPPLPLTIQLVLALAGIGHTAWVAWCVLSWRVEQIAVTDSRLIRVSGILTTTVDTVPLSEITDLSLRCSIPGRVFRYGRLRIETAGQNRTLTRLDFLPSAVCRAMLTGTLRTPSDRR